jgi:hypothetical protein
MYVIIYREQKTEWLRLISEKVEGKLSLAEAVDQHNTTQNDWGNPVFYMAVNY